MGVLRIFNFNLQHAYMHILFVLQLVIIFFPIRIQ